MTAEFELIKNFFSDLDLGSPQCLLGVGDDCAILESPPPGQHLAISTDTLNADVHFPANAKGEWVASRALRSNISDLAAMGAVPHGFTLALSLPAVDSQWMQSFAQGLHATAKEYALPLIGGDTTSGALSLTVTVIGCVDPAQALRRDGAKLKDGIYVDGSLGDGAAALQLIEQDALKEGSYLHKRFYAPHVNTILSQKLCAYAHAAIDVSDGLLADLGHILTASKVGAEIDVDCLPVSEGAQSVASNSDVCRSWALTGGDDYRLCFTMPDEFANSKLLSEFDLRRIGQVNDSETLQLRDRKGRLQLAPLKKGFQHFSSHAGFDVL
ncbi:MAG: thiamine-phosphate kinase [Pseudomonadales bacterium]